MPTRTCPFCGAELKAEILGGLCPKCVLKKAVAEPEGGGPGPDGREQRPEAGASKQAVGAGAPERPQAESAPPPLTIRYFGDYELIEEIGHGGMGVVYKARQVSLDHLVAVKMIRAGELATEEEVQRFNREAQAAANLDDHPHIVTVYEVGQHAGMHYFSMRLVEGRSLAQEMAQAGDRKPDARCQMPDGQAPAGVRYPASGIRHPASGIRYPPAQAARLLAKVARAVHHAHQRGILHRDLKPGNILLDAKGEPHVTDFGLAKRVDVPSDITRSETVMGTPDYMSPEQAQARNRHLTTATDIWSLGAVFYHLLTGRAPFHKETAWETMQAVVNEEPVRPSALNRQVDRDLETICLKCLEKDPQRRYGSADALADDLEHWLRNEPIRARPVTTFERVVKWGKRNPAVAGLAAATVLLLVAVAVGSTISAIRIGVARRAEHHQRQRAEAAVTRLEIERVESLFAADDSSKALAILARLLRQQPTNRVVAERLMNALGERNFCLPSAQPLQHADRINMGQFSPDGRWVVTASKDSTARLWDARTGLPVGKPFQHAGDVKWAAFSPDSQRLATASSDKTARVWDALTGQPTTAPLQHGGTVLCVGWSPDGRRLVTTSRDQTVRLWDAATGQPIGQPIANSGEAYFACFSPDGGRLLVAVDGQGARVFDATTGAELASFPHWRQSAAQSPCPFPRFAPDGERLVLLEGMAVSLWDLRRAKYRVASLRHEDEVTSAEFSPDGRLVATASVDNTARIWDARSGGAATPPLKHDHYVMQARFNADGTGLLTSSGDGSVRVWDPRTGKPLTEPLRHQGRLYLAQFSPDSQRVLTGTDSSAAWLWEVRSGIPRDLTLRHPPTIRYAVFSPNGRLIGTACWDGKAYLWDARSGQRFGAPFDAGGRIWHIQFSPDGQRIALASDGRHQVWDVEVGKRVALLESKLFEGYRLRFSPDGRRIVNGQNAVAKVWDTTTGQTVLQVSHDGADYAEFCPDGTCFVTCGADKAARLWNAQTGRPLGKPLMHEESVRWAAFSRDGQRVATSGHRDKSVRIWEVRTGKKLAQLAHADEVALRESVEFSPDGNLVATAAGNVAQVWNAHTGVPVAAPLKHGGSVNSVRFSPDGKRLVTACNDGTARLWDAQSGHPLGDSVRHGARVYYAEFSPDGRFFVTASADGTARIVEVALATGLSPEWLPALAEAVAGRRIDDQNVSVVVPAQELCELRQRLSETAGQDNYGTWAKWFLADSATRTLSPSSPVTMPEYVQRRIEENTLASLREAVQLSPTNLTALLRLGLALSRQTPAGNLQGDAEVEWLLRRLDQLRPDLSGVGRVRAELLASQQKTNEALRVLDETIAWFPEDPESWESKGRLLEKAARPDEAYNAYTEALSLAGTNQAFARIRYEVLSRRSNLLRRLGRTAEAQADSDQILESEFASAGECNERAWALATWPVGRRDPERAVRLARNAVRLEPTSWIFRNTLGVACYRTGEHRQAIEALLETGKLNRDGLIGHDLVFLAMAHHQLGETNKAKEYYDQLRHWEAKSGAAMPANWRSELRVFQAEAEDLLGLPHAEWPAAAQPVRWPVQIPPRDPQAKPRLIDLTPFYNESLTNDFGGGQRGNNLRSLPQGVQELAGVEFDIRGLVHLSGAVVERMRPGFYPQAVRGIPVNQKVARLHLLQAVGWRVQDATKIGACILHFADDQSEEYPILYGEHVRDFWADPARPERVSQSVVAWVGDNEAARKEGKRLQLFKTSWENPRPDVEVKSLDFVSAMTNCAPFLIALTVESEEMPEYWLNKAGELEAQGELAEALATLEQALNALPTAPSLWIAKGKLLDKAARPDEALQAFSKAIELTRTDTNAFGPALKEARLGRVGVLRQLNRFDETAKENLAALDIPARDPKAGPHLVDLSCYYNAGLDRAWLNTNRLGNNLATLPHGVQTLAGVQFDVRGVVQLSGLDLVEVNPIYPSEVKDIRVGLKGKRLHFLHAVGWRMPDAVQVGTYTLHYADGQRREIPLLYGQQVRDWWGGMDQKPLGADTVVGWNGTNAFQQPFRVFKTTWTNPRPEMEIESLDFLSTVTKSAPFLIAVTVE